MQLLKELKSKMIFYLFCFRYWHRSLNPKKLIEVKFSHLKQNMTMQRTIKLYRLPEVRVLCYLFFPSSIELL